MNDDLIKKLIGIVLKRKKIVFSLILLLTIFFSFGLNKLYFFNKFTSWLDQNDPVAKLFIELSERFSINELIVVVVEAPEGVFESRTVEKIADFCQELQAGEEIFAVNSLTTMVDISSSSEEGVVVRDLLDVYKTMPIEEFAAYILSRELYRQQIVSLDSRLAMVSVFIKGSQDSEKVFKTKIVPLSRKIFNQEKLYYSGIPANAHFLNIYSLQDLKFLSPLIFLLIVLILTFSFRRVRGVIYPLLTTALAIVWTFGLIGFTHTPLTFVTAIIPVLLVALGSAYAIHLVNSYLQNETDCSDVQDKVKRATANVFLPILLAGVTTFIGFISFFSAGLSLIANFGVFSACGIGFALIISLTLLPALESSFKFKKKSCANTEKQRSFAGLGSFVVRNYRLIFFICTLWIIIFSLFIGRINREVNFTEYFPKKSIPYLSNKVVEKNFQGAMPVIIDFKSSSCKSPQILRLLRQTENYLIGFRRLSKPLSISTLIAELNLQLNGRFAIPEKEGQIANLWFFIEGRKELEQILNEELKETLVFARYANPRTFALKEVQDYLRHLEKEFARGVYSFDLSLLTLQEQAQLKKLELTALSKELYWILSGYLNREVSFDETYTLLESIASRIDQAGYNQQLAFNVIDDYFQSEEFELDVSSKKKEEILKICRLSFQNNLPDKDNLLKKLMQIEFKPAEKIPLAEEWQSFAETLIYKVKEKTENELVETSFAEFFKPLSEDEYFARRIKALLYDLGDSLVVLSAVPEITISKGQPVELKISISGFPALMMQLDRSLFNSQLQSIALAYFLTLILMMLIYKRLALGFVATIPIIFTVAVVYGFLGIFNISLDYATMLTGAVAIGVGIDYSIHLLYATLQRRKSGKSLESALSEAIAEKAPAILTNAISVLAGFTVLLFSAMLILRNFGATMIAAMLLAAFSAIFYLPAILLIFRKQLKI